ncbi:MAG: hypothetical protein GXO58_00400 [Thermodesulfobacteria bacterium]|nr:hypothetical protein [Thermodesulfobacteriota bacterium]
MPRLLKTEQRHLLLEFFHERFGMDQGHFDPFDIFAFSRQAFLFRRQDKALDWPASSFVRCGLPFVRNVAGYLKPTTVFVQRFGNLATKNVLDMEMEQVGQLCSNGEIILSALPASLDTGYVIIKMQQHYLGIGLLLEGNRLLCRFPKAMREAISRLTPG